jgi:hypothetical protein
MGFNWGLVGFDGDSNIFWWDIIDIMGFFMRHTLRCPQTCQEILEPGEFYGKNIEKH